MKRLKICVWQESPSMHQIALIKALKNKCELIWVMQKTELAKDRKEMGWSDGKLEPDYCLESYEKMKIFIESLKGDWIHLFGGFHATEELGKCLKYCFKQKKTVFVQTEAYNYVGFKGFLRVIKFRVQRYLYYDRLLKGIFACGNLGVIFFTDKSNFDKSKVFPFGYFTIKEPVNFVKNDNVQFKIVFVGQLVKRKGVDILLNSLKHISGNWKLDIIGSGPKKQLLEKLALKNGLSEKVKYLDNLSNLEVQQQISKSDLLILPSRWDGWGAVVSESLMQGTPAIASDKCGSASLLQEDYRGEVVKSNSISSLKIAIEKRIAKGKVKEIQRRKILEWSKCLTGDVAAEYMIKCMAGENPMNPWI